MERFEWILKTDQTQRIETSVRKSDENSFGVNWERLEVQAKEKNKLIDLLKC